MVVRHFDTFWLAGLRLEGWTYAVISGMIWTFIGMCSPVLQMIDESRPPGPKSSLRIKIEVILTGIIHDGDVQYHVRVLFGTVL